MLPLPRTFNSLVSSRPPRCAYAQRLPSRAGSGLVLALSMLLALGGAGRAEAAAKPRAARAEALREARARRHFRRGEAAFAAGDFRAALADYDRAFRLAPLAGLLFNIAQCHRNLGAHERAIYTYKLYLARLPEAPNREAVLALIAELQPLVARPATGTGAKGSATTPAAASPPRKGAPFEQAQGSQDVVVWGEGAEAAVASGPAGEAARAGVNPAANPTSRPAAKALLGPGLTTRFTAEPVDQAPFYRRWWFWTAISTAVVASATAVGAHYASQPRHHALNPSTLPLWALPPLR
ncbi:MAG: hypothetical protein IPL40_00470 [Proteobacteria bacterium]|nr:hypothetical protein [Pseudomonadota bacterium]